MNSTLREMFNLANYTNKEKQALAITAAGVIATGFGLATGNYVFSTVGISAAIPAFYHGYLHNIFGR